mmetsp:Transcript_120833/g.353011  ORF Transcript_120833/g.353011 Transcript_120833/m.353011 type:complete len:611 (-) Transcript_120833:47-1879(-)
MTDAPAWAPPAYEPSLAVRALALLGAEACSGSLGRCLPPAPDVLPTDREWYDFVLHTSLAPPLLLACGGAGTLVAMLLLCRTMGAPPDKAGSRSQLVPAGLFFLFGCAAAGLSLQSALEGYRRGAESFRHAADGFRHAEQLLGYAGNTSAKIGREVLMLTEACPHLEELFDRSLGSKGWDAVQEFQASAGKDAQEYGRLAQKARANITAIAPLLDQIGTRVSGWPEFLVFSLLAPAKILGVGGVLVLAIALWRCTRGSESAGDPMEGPFAVVLFIILAIVMLAATCGAVATLGLTVASGSFCLDPGAALPSLAQRSLSYVAADLAAASQGAAGGRALEAARQHAQSITSSMKSHQRELDLLELLCDEVYRMGLRPEMRKLEKDTAEAAELLSGRTAREHFREVVQESVCGTSLEASALLAFFQALVGLVCLPLLAAPALSLLRSDPVRQPLGPQVLPLSPMHSFNRSMMSPVPVMGLGASPPSTAARFDSALSSLKVWSSGNDPSTLQSYQPVLGGQAMRSGNPVMHSAMSSAQGNHLMQSAPAALHGPGQDPLMSFVPSRKAMVPTPPASRERRVHFADERGKSLFGSQASLLSSMQSGSAQPWGSGFV